MQRRGKHMLYAKFKKTVLVLLALIMLMTSAGCTSKADEYNEKGLDYYTNRDYDSAIGCFDEAIGRNGKKAEYYVNKCFAQMAKEDYEGAADSINSAYTLDPESKYVLRAEGILHYRTGKYDEAIASFDKCLGLVGDYVTELEYDVIKYKADSQISMGYAEAAADSYSVLIATQENNKPYYYWRAKSYIMAGDEAAAVKDLKDYILCDKNYEAYIQSYYELANAGYTESAVNLLNEALKLSDSSSSDYKYRGMIYYILGDYNKAITEFQKIEDADKSAEICVYEGLAFSALGDTNNAADFYQKAVDMGESDAALFYEIALCNMSIGNYEDAIYYIIRGIEIGSDETLEKLMYLQIICYEYAGKYGEAADSAAAYIEAFGSSEEMEHELAFLRSRSE